MQQPRHLQLVSVGSAPPGLLKALEEPLAQQLGVSAAAGGKVLPSPAYAYNKDRQQYHASAILRRIAASLDPGQRHALGLCDVDVFVPDSPFVFGEADREARVGVVSLFRLRQGADGEVLRRRAQVEAVHQAGHLWGLSYCEDPRCVMYLAQSVQDVDRKGVSLCSLCRNEFTKLPR